MNDKPTYEQLILTPQPEPTPEEFSRWTSYLLSLPEWAREQLAFYAINPWTRYALSSAPTRANYLTLLSVMICPDESKLKHMHAIAALHEYGSDANTPGADLGPTVEGETSTVVCAVYVRKLEELIPYPYSPEHPPTPEAIQVAVRTAESIRKTTSDDPIEQIARAVVAKAIARAGLTVVDDSEAASNSDDDRSAGETEIFELTSMNPFELTSMNPEDLLETELEASEPATAQVAQAVPAVPATSQAIQAPQAPQATQQAIQQEVLMDRMLSRMPMRGKDSWH